MDAAVDIAVEAARSCSCLQGTPPLWVQERMQKTMQVSQGCTSMYCTVYVIVSVLKLNILSNKLIKYVVKLVLFLIVNKYSRTPAL